MVIAVIQSSLRTTLCWVLLVTAFACGIANAEEWEYFGQCLYTKSWVNAYTSNSSPKFAASLQVLVSSNEVGLLCSGVNMSQAPIIADRAGFVGNDLVFNYGVKEYEGRLGPYFERYIPPNVTSTWYFSCGDLSRLDLPAGLAQVQWRFKTTRSNPLWVSKSTYSERVGRWPEKSRSSNALFVARLAYVPGITNGGELGFFLLNNSNQELLASEFSFLSNNLFAVASSVKYVQRLDTPECWPSNLCVLPKTWAQWSVPFVSTINLIPKAAISNIVGAGAKFDLVWSLNGCESTSLPLCIGERPKTAYEQYENDGAECLKKYDVIRRMDTNSNLASSFRLAGGKTEPMLVVRVVSQESEDLLGGFVGAGIKNSRYSFSLPSCPKGKVSMGPYFLVRSRETLDYMQAPSWFSKVHAVSGMVLECDAFFAGHRCGVVWIAFPDTTGQIREVYANREPSSPAILAFAYTGETSSGFAFVLWNKTAHPLVTANLSSRILFSTRSMNYKREVKLDGVEVPRDIIPTNMHKASFVPWDAVMKRIPAEDLTRLIKAGGEVDLTWKIGAWESRPLPLLLD